MSRLHFLVVLVGLLATISTIYNLHKLGERPFRKWHHYYVGLAFLAVPTAPGYWALLSLALWVIGLYILYDEWNQHSRQRKKPNYKSPLHNAYVQQYREWFT